MIGPVVFVLFPDDLFSESDFASDEFVADDGELDGAVADGVVADGVADDESVCSACFASGVVVVLAAAVGVAR